MYPVYRFPSVRPEIPSMSQWSNYFERAEHRNWFTNFGELSLELERELLSHWGFSDSSVICTNNGTTSIAAPLIAENIAGPVLLPAFTFPATLSAVKMAGCQPELVDVSLEEWLIDIDQLDRRLGESKARAVVLVSPFGLKCDFSRHIEVATAHRAAVIIDSAAGLGLERSNVESSERVYEGFSMHATKPFGVGEGGAIFCAQQAASRIRSALNFGLPTRLGAEVSPWGLNGKLSEAHAAVGLAVMDTFQARLDRRRQLAARYIEQLIDVPEIRFPDDPHQSTWQVFPVLMPTDAAANSVVDAARHLGMEVRRYYRPSLTKWVKGRSCPNSESLANRMICFPIYSCDHQTAEAMAGIVGASVTKALQGHEA